MGLLTLDVCAGGAPLEVARHGLASRRLRLAVPELVGNAAMARRIERDLDALPGVTEVSADARSGRVLVRYQRGARLLDGLHEHVAVRTTANGRKALAGEWHAMLAPQVLSALGAEAGGLTRRDAAGRLAQHGSNVLGAVAARSRLAVLVEQVDNLPMGLLLASSGLSALLGDLLDATAILVVVAINAGIGYVIERKNEELLASWQKLKAGTVQVLRDRAVRNVPAAELVPGDVILCSAGDIVPADGRVLEASRLTCDEAPLTGESEPQRKDPAPVGPDAPLGERSSMVYAGTTVSSGRGRVLVTETGRATELAHVQDLVEEARAPETPLARRLGRLGRNATLLAAGASAVAGVAGLLHGQSIGRVLRGAVALGVAAIPEGLPAVSTTALVRSMQRMRKRGIVVRRLAAAETLGGVTVICADKTGTLTENQMRLEVLDPGGPVADLRARPDALFDDPVTLALLAGLLNSDVEVDQRGKRVEILGSSTERALVLAAQRAGLDPERLAREFPRRSLRERTNGISFVVTTHEDPRAGGAVAFIKGAPEQVVEHCDLDDPGKASVLERNDALAGAGLRVLALGWKRLAGMNDAPDHGFQFIALAGLRDPLRATAREAVRAARRAGIRTIILTGDQRRTAEAIARQVGLEGEALDGSELARMLDEGDPEADRRLQRVSVLSRVTPADKVAIVRALGRRGEIVAMAGDGINDAPALKAADVGIAVGVQSSDLARQVADVVLASEDLSSILSAIGEGRVVQDNLRHALRFLFATNLSEVALVLGAAVLGAGEPITPMQLLWINLLTDTFPALALVLEPGQPDVLDRPPARPDAPLLAPEAWRRVGRDGAVLAAVGAAAFAAGGPSLSFVLLTASQLAYAATCRPAGARLDARFVGLVGGSVALQGLTLLSRGLRRTLGLGPRSVLEPLGFAVGLLLPPLILGLSQPEIVLRVEVPR